MKKFFLDLKDKLRKINLIRKAFFFIKLILFSLNIFFHKLKAIFFQKNNIVILPHEGLGDLVVIIPAIIQLSMKYDSVYVALNSWVIKAIQQIYNFKDNVKLIEYDHDKSYIIDKANLNKLTSYGHLIKLGRYGLDPIYNYPNSFFNSLGVALKYVGKNIDFKLEDLNTDFFIPEKYHYFNLQNSNENLNYKNIDASIENYIVFIDVTKIGIGKSMESLSIHNIPENKSLTYNLFLALNSQEIHVTDAGFFNILMHIKTKPIINVYTRPHNHSHNKKLFPLKYDGSVKKILSNH